MTSEARPEFGDAGRELIDLAAVYALDAVSESERRDIESRLVAADPEVAAMFEREARAIRETMATVSASTAAEPSAHLRRRLLDAVAAESDSFTAPVPLAARRNRRRNFLLAAAAAVVIAIGGITVASRLSQNEAPPTSAQVFAAHDVRTSSGAIEGGGTATVVYSKDVGAGVLVMNNVKPPVGGTVYQMWLLGPQGPESAGIMDSAAVAPSTTAVLEGLSQSTALGFSVEPPGGSTKPTGQIFAELPLS